MITHKFTWESLAKESYKVTISKDRSIENAPFFKKKMKRAKEILSVAGLPKGY